MEVFGVVAGAVGLLHLSVKGSRILRAIPEIEDDFQELCEETENIYNWIEHAKLTIPLAALASPFIRGQIAQIGQKFTKIVNDLKEIEEKLKKEAADGSFKVKKARWLVESEKIAKLRNKAREAKQDLLFIFNWQQQGQADYLTQALDGISRDVIRDERISAILRHVTVIANNLPPGEPTFAVQGKVEELPDSWTEQDEKDAGQGHEIDSDRNHTATKKDVSTDSGQARIKSRAVVPRMKLKCPELCDCRCHSRLGYKRADSTSGILSRLGVNVDTPSWDPKCRCGGNWDMKFRPPWLRARMLILSGGYHSGWLTMSLRTTRILSTTDSLWEAIDHSAERMRYAITHGTVIFPDDQSEPGFEIIEYIIIVQNYGGLETLLKEWESILPKQGLSKRAGWAANRSLRRAGNELDDNQVRLLQQVSSFAEMDDELETTRVHEAAEQGQGIADALAEEPWAKDVLDRTGTASLHIAAERDHIYVLQQLIDAGADINVPDMDGWTPLMLAARSNSIACMRQLILAGCRLDHQDLDGSTALHVAARYASTDAAKILLTSGQGRGATYRAAARARARMTDRNGRLPLHQLAGLGGRSARNATADVIVDIAKILLDAYPEGIHIHNSTGRTPLMVAVAVQNLPLMKHLDQAGAAWTVVDIYSRNILHYAARFFTVATLEYLVKESSIYTKQGEKQSLTTIDHELRDSFDSTPWESFVFCAYVEPWQLQTKRHLDARTGSLFIDLYRHFRDRNIRHDILILQKAQDALSRDDLDGARDHLSSIVTQKASGNKESTGWYRAFAKQIDAGEKEAAVAGIEQDLHDLRDELQSSPRDQSCRLDGLIRASQWVEVSDHSFWVEPAGAFAEISMGSASGDDGKADNNESGHSQDARGFVTSSRDLDYDLITKIYSDVGELLYSVEDSQRSPLDFLQQYI